MAPRGAGPPRAIERPKARLKAAQRVVLRELLDRIPAHPAAHGFVRGRSAVTHAALHAGRRIVLRFERLGPTRAAGSAIVAEEGLVLHPAKTQLMHQAGRQRVCGIVVNVAPNLAREEADRLRAILHEAATHGPEHANRDDRPAFRAHLEGRVAWAAALNPARGARLQAQLAAIAWGA